MLSLKEAAEKASMPYPISLCALAAIKGISSGIISLRGVLSTFSYNFDLRWFQINRRRTNHPWGGGTDTVKISLGLKVGDYQYPALFSDRGDLGDTGIKYGIDFGFRNIRIDDLNAPVQFSFMMMNSGHGNTQIVEDVMKKGADYLVNVAVASIPATGFWGLVASGASAAGAWLVSHVGAIIFANCDGLVASDVYTFSGGDLLNATTSGPLELGREYPGLESPEGCGHNSNYFVDCLITRK